MQLFSRFFFFEIPLLSEVEERTQRLERPIATGGGLLQARQASRLSQMPSYSSAGGSSRLVALLGYFPSEHIPDKIGFSRP